MPSTSTDASSVRVTWECGACGHRFTSVQTADQTTDPSSDPTCPECSADNPNYEDDVALEDWGGASPSRLASVADESRDTLRYLNGRLKYMAATLSIGKDNAGRPSAESARRQFRAVAEKLEKEARRLRAAARE